MRFRFALVCALALTAAGADLPYAGKWKMNSEKSDFGQVTMTIEGLPDGEWQVTSFGITYKVKMDGQDYPDGMGGTIAWKAAGENTWQSVQKANGKIVETDTFQLSPDAKTLTVMTKQVRADGGSLDGSAEFARASGDQGLAGKWQTQKVTGGSATIELVATGVNGLTFKDLDQGMSCAAKLDGKDYPCTGPAVAPGFTVAMQKSAESLDFVVKKDGKPIFQASYTVSPDGRTLTETGGTATGGDKFKIVFDRM